MEIKIDLNHGEMNIILQALDNHGDGYNKGSADQRLIYSIMDKFYDAQSELQCLEMGIKAIQIKKDCPWATAEAIDEYLMESFFEENCGSEDFKKSLLG